MSIIPRHSQKRYIPILKTKAGELGGLSQLTSQQKSAITPLLELHNSDPLKDIATLVKYSTKISQAWPGAQPLYVDGNNIAWSTNTNLPPSPSFAFFSQLLHAGLAVIPVTDPYRPLVYQTAVANVVQSTGRGICIRIPTGSLNNRTQIINDVQTILSNLGITATSTDLLLDFSDIPQSLQNTASMYIPWVASEINALCSIAPWRDIILAGTSFPQIIQGNSQTLSAITRVEWMIWDQLRLTNNLQRVPDFSDYTCLPAVHATPAPYMAPSPKIRYATDDRWLVAKGQSVKQAPPTQYYGLAQVITGRPEFCGAPFSFGDSYISQRASATPPSTGYFTQWLSADINHHISYVIAQI